MREIKELQLELRELEVDIRNARRRWNPSHWNRDARSAGGEVLGAALLFRRPVVDEVGDGFGWEGWSLRTGRILETLFPFSD